MSTVFRALGSIVSGLALAFALVVVVEVVSLMAHPFPTDFGGTKEEMCKHVERFPQWVLALVVPAWAGTTFASTWMASRIGNRGCGLFVGLLLLAAVAMNVAMLPYPIWFKVSNLIAIPVAIFLGLRLSSRRENSEVRV